MNHLPNIYKGELKFFILNALSKKPLHGYKIMQCIGNSCLNLWKPTAGSMYPALEELRKEALIELKKEATTGRKKKEYAITAAGRKRLEELGKHVEQTEQYLTKYFQSPELDKYSTEDLEYLGQLMNSIAPELVSKYHKNMFDFAMLFKKGKVEKKQELEFKKIASEFLEKLEKINRK